MKLGALWAVVLFPVVLSAQPGDDALEDIMSSTDQEAPIADSLEHIVDLLLKPSYEPDGSPTELPAFNSRTRFHSAAYWNHNEGRPATWRNTWARSRLTAYAHDAFHADLLLVRRSGDTRLLDELHLSLSGAHDASDIKYVVGTYQIDWATGILSSSSFGSARSRSYYGTTNTTAGLGIVARNATNDASWLRGIAIQRSFQSARIALFGNNRDWNASTNEHGATLTGTLSTESADDLNRRDAVSETSAGGMVQVMNEHGALGILAQSSNFTPELTSGELITSVSCYGSAQFQSVHTLGEFARSRSESAWSAVVARGTDRWSGAFYAMYASPEYFAPRSQSPYSFGSPFSNGRLVGVRANVRRGSNDFGLDIHSDRDVEGQPRKFSDELVAGVESRVSDNLELRTRVRASRSGGTSAARQSVSIRLEPTWNTDWSWSARVEVRRFELENRTDSGTGTYLHAQVVRKRGSFKPGFRVAAFSLGELDAPMSVYEPTIRGAYPLESFSGDGTRVSGWITWEVKTLELQAKAARVTRSMSDDSYEFGLAMTLHR